MEHPVATAAATAAALTISPLAASVSWCATFVNIVMLSSPLQLVFRFVYHPLDPVESGDLLTSDAGSKHQPTLMMVNGVSIIPLLANVACCLSWVIYGLITGIAAVLVGNGLGVIVGLLGTIAYVLVYSGQMHQVKMQFGALSPAAYPMGSGGGSAVVGITAASTMVSNNPVHRAYAQALSVQKQITLQIGVAGLACVLLVWYYFEAGAGALGFIRIFCIISTLGMFGAPLAVIQKVVNGQAIASVVFTWSNIISTVGNCLLWIVFGLLVNDLPTIVVPNVLGVIVALAQGSLLLRDRKHVGLNVK